MTARVAIKCTIFSAAVLALVGPVARVSFGQVFNVTTPVGVGPGSVYYAIQQADAYGNGATINFQLPFAPINLDDPLPDISVGMTINGDGSNSLSGLSQRRIFFVNAPAGQTVQFNNLTLMNGLAQGGNGNSGGGAGGGGAGLGGAVFVNSGNVVFSSVAFQNNSVKGGNGGSTASGGGGGGGGMGFGGGAGGTNSNILGHIYLLGGGGGGGARTSAGLPDAGGMAGKGGGVNGALGAIDGGDTLDGGNASTIDGGGGGGGIDETFPASSAAGGHGGNGSDFGGGGGGGSSYVNGAGMGGNGGFGAGGGGGADANSGSGGFGGNGGFGGGGGGGGGSPNVMMLGPFPGGLGGFGGGVGGGGNEGAGGGGAALGAAVFVRSGSVTFTNSSTDAGSLTAGAGGVSGLADGHNGVAGSAAGGALFLTGGNAIFNVSLGNTEAIAGSIAQSSASSITVIGGGTLVLAANNGGANGFSGGLAVNGGSTLSIAADNALGAASGGISLSGGSILQITGTSDNLTARAITLGSGGGGINISTVANQFTVTHPIGGSGGLNFVGPGKLILGAANTFAGPVTIANGTLVANYGYDGAAATFIPASTITVNNGGTLQLGSAAGANNVLGAGLNAPNVSIPAIAINGTGSLTTGAGTTHNVGQLSLNSGATIAGDPSPPAPYGDFTFNSAVTANPLSSDASITAPGGVDLRINIPFNVSAGTGKLNVSAVLRDEVGSTGGVTMNGPGTMVLSANNTYSGGTTVSGGTLVVQNFGLPATSIVVNASGTLQYDASGGNINQLRADLSGTGKLVKTGSNQLVFGNGGANAVNWNLSAGALIDVQGGTLVGGTSVNDFWTNDNASLNVAGGATFSGVEANVQIDALTGAGTVQGGYAFGGTETIGIAGGSGTFSGTLQDTSTGSGFLLSLVKAGTGTETLSGVNTYSGSTTVNNGTLATTMTGALGAGPLAVNAANAITSVVTLGNNQTVSQLSGTIAGTGSARVNVGAGTTLTVSQSANTTFAGTVALTAGATAGTGGALVKSSGGALEINGGLSLGNNTSMSVTGGTLRLKIAGGLPSVGTGVTASVSGSATLELAGAVSALGTAIPADRVAVTNSSNAAAGLLVSVGNQQVGRIDGTGNTQVNSGTSLTADHIIQGALIIGGTSGSPALVTIDASDLTGNPLGQSSAQTSGLILAGSLAPSPSTLPNGAATLTGGSRSGSAIERSLASVSASTSNTSAVPEPSSLALAALAIAAITARTAARRSKRTR